MKRKQSQAVETHNLSSRQYPMPGTDLVTTNAIPYNQAEDVDDSGGFCQEMCECGHTGRHYSWEGHSGHMAVMSFTEQRPKQPQYPASNPTRARKR